MRFLTLLLCLTLAFPISCNAASYSMERAAGPIAVDGKLDDAAWRQARVYTNFNYPQAAPLKTAPAPTSLRMLTDGTALYFGIHCDEPSMATLKDGPLPRNGPVWERDCVEVFLDPTGKGNEYYQFMVSAANTRFNAYYIEGGHTQRPYDAVWQSAVFKGADFWSAEIKIPLSALYFTAASEFTPTWLVNVGRERYAGTPAELTSWSPVKQNFHDTYLYNQVDAIPAKAARFDLRIDDLRMQVQTAGKNGYAGPLQVSTEATRGTAGNYQFKLFDASSGALLARSPLTVGSGTSVAAVPAAHFATQGKANVLAQLCSAQGEIIFASYFAVPVEYKPLTINIDEPFYGHAIFPGQQVARIAGTVVGNLSAQTLLNADLTVSLDGPGGAHGNLSKAMRAGSANFSFDASNLQIGDYTLTARLHDGGTVLATATTQIRKLARPAAGHAVWIDRNLNVVIDGKPIFVRSWYGGEGYLVSAALLKSSPHPDSKWVDAFDDTVSMEAERLDPSERNERIKTDVMPSQKVFDGMRAAIEANRGKDFLFYYLVDEPDYRRVSPVYLKYQYDFIKKLDPYHPVMMITMAPARYAQCTDILDSHPYMNPEVDGAGKRTMHSPTQVRDKVREGVLAGAGKIPMWLTPQAFSYAFEDRFADYPTFDEFDVDVYTALANGCKGFTPYVYYDHFNSWDLRLGVDFIYETLAKLDQFLLQAPGSLPVRVTSPGDGVDVCLKRSGGKLLVIAVNLLPTPTTAAIEAPAFNGLSQLYGYRQHDGATVLKGRTTLHFAPYQVQLLTSVPMGANLKSVEILRAQIAAANAGRARPGNILYGRGAEIEGDSSQTRNLSPDNAIMPRLLTDGMRDTLAFLQNGPEPARVELDFPTFVPRFKRAEIYSSTVENLEFYIWKAGDWVKIGEVKGNQKPVIELNFPELVSTVKIKMLMTKTHPGTKAELYELELYEK